MCIKDKIAKIMALAGNNPSEAEALAAATKVRELLRKHGLTSADITLPSDSPANEPIEENEGIVKGRWNPWDRDLAWSVCNITGAKYYTSRGYNKTRFVLYGYQSDVQAAEATFTSLSAIMEAAAKRERKKSDYYLYGEPGDKRVWLNNFRKGFASRVLARTEADLRKEKADKSDEGSKWALIVVDKNKAVVEWQGVNLPRLKTVRSRSSGRPNMDGYSRGKAAGSACSLGRVAGALE